MKVKGYRIPLNQPWHWFSLGFGSGLLPKAPGTWGTLLAWPLAYIWADWSWQAQLSWLVVATVGGCWCCEQTARLLQTKDPSMVVWDEMVGLWWLLACTPPFWSWGLIAVVLFRLFDIVKPWPIRWCDQSIQGGIGIMLDDLLAALLAAGAIQLLQWV